MQNAILSPSVEEGKLPPAILLMGPTASGKSALAIALAQALNAEIISVDSALIYRGMDIGTAKPTAAERSGIKHHLIDILDPAESFSSGRFRTLALSLMAEITRRGKIPLLTGGTMLYFNALLHGLAALPAADVDIRAQLTKLAVQHGNTYLHQRLQEVDPDSAARIHCNDPQRVQRALEVYELTGKPLTVLHAEAKSTAIPYRIFKVVLAPQDRAVLHQIIAGRFQRMLDRGLIEEVRRLFLRGDLSLLMPSMRAVGYRQVWSYLNGEYELETMHAKAVIATRQLAKRQLTWLRRETDAVWLPGEEENLIQQILPRLNEFCQR